MIYTCDDGDLYYEVSGPPGAPVVAFIHGAGLNRSMFDPQVSTLAREYRVVVWDMPGHGRSSKLEGNLPFERMAHHLHGILKAADVERAVLVGHSLGSWVAQHAAILYPQKVQAIVSIAGTPLEKGVTRLEAAGFRTGLWISKLLPGRMLFKRTAEGKAVTPEAQDFFRRSLEQIGKRQFLWIVAGMLDAGNRLVDRPPDQPLFITHGEHEWPKSVARVNAEWHRQVPGSRYAVIPDAGHNANQDNPEVFNRLLVEFLDSHGEKARASV